MSMEPENVFSAFRGRPFQATLMFSSFAIAVIAYTYAINIYDSDRNFVRQLWRSVLGESYSFYSGSPGGIYLKIGEALEDETGQEFGNTFQNKRTSGAFENAMRVAGNRKSCGLIEEVTLTKNDFFRNSVNYVTPLYMERFHIIYRDESPRDEENGGPESGPKALSGDLESVNFLKTRVIYTGHHRSGTKIFTSYLLGYLGGIASTDSRFKPEDGPEGLGDGAFFTTNSTRNFSELLKDLENNDEETGKTVLMNMSGAPLPEVADAFKRDKHLRLIGIDASLLVALNSKYKLNLRPATFPDAYEGGDDIPTIGSFAFLVCSEDVPNFVILKLLRILNDQKDLALGLVALKEYEFFHSFEKQYGGYLRDLFRNFFLFAATTVVATALIAMFAIWCISSFKQVGYFREITTVYKTLPENTKLDESAPPFKKPIIFEQQSGIISRLVTGVSGLTKITQRVRADYETGGVTARHYNHLLNSIRYLRDLFQANLFQRLVEVIEAGHWEGVTGELLRHYHTAGYLTSLHYFRLVECLERQSTVAASRAPLEA